MNRQQAEQIAAWANTHDCGVTPTALVVEEPEGIVIEIRGTQVDRAGVVSEWTERARNYSDVRAHLGY